MPKNIKLEKISLILQLTKQLPYKIAINILLLILLTINILVKEYIQGRATNIPISTANLQREIYCIRSLKAGTHGTSQLYVSGCRTQWWCPSDPCDLKLKVALQLIRV